MADRTEMLEAALEVYPEGLALLDLEGRVVFWNSAAETITGYAGVNLVGRTLPPALESLTHDSAEERTPGLCEGPYLDPSLNQELNQSVGPRRDSRRGHGSLVHTQHQRGHDVPAFLRTVILRDSLGVRMGIAAVFHPAERLAALPHGETSEGSEVTESLRGMRDRLESEFEAFQREGVPLGILWIIVDQAEEMRKTHGARACECMLESVERTLANALRPGEEIGRWGDTEFLVLSHESCPEVLANHGQVLAGIARTTDFRWWGDRATLTVSVGAAHAEAGEELTRLLRRAKGAMETSEHDGGNRARLAGRERG